MVRSILGILAGIVAGGVLVGILEIPGMVICFRLAPTTSMGTQIEASRGRRPPLPALVLAGAVAWTLGPLVGSWLAAMIARRGLLGCMLSSSACSSCRQHFEYPQPAASSLAQRRRRRFTPRHVRARPWLAEKTIRKRPRSAAPRHAGPEHGL